MDDTNFRLVVQEFTTAVINLLKSIKAPSIDTSERLSTIGTRTYKNDRNVKLIADFMDILETTLYNVHDVVLHMKVLFITKSNKSVELLVYSLTQFLVFLHAENIMDRLQYFQIEFERTKLEFVSSLKTIKHIICKICTVSIDITAFFIPPVLPARFIITGISQYIDSVLDEKQNTVIKYDIDTIINHLLHIQLNTEALCESIGMIQSCINDNNTEAITKDLNQIQDDYLTLKKIHLEIRGKINKYDNLEKSVFYKCFSRFKH